MNDNLSRRAYRIILLFVYGIMPCISVTQLKSPVVQTDMGPIEGKSIQVSIKRHQFEHVWAFLGIPYAEPPVGHLRYAAPLNKSSWAPTVLQAKDFGNSCFHQNDTVFPGFSGAEMWNAPNTKAEDCLYLNIWRPLKPNPSGVTVPKEELLAVMIWIYGGSFFSGTSSLAVYDGRYLAGAEKVVVVSFNYRLGPLGFLPPLADVTPGNVGLLDQTMALQWIKRNIRNFGGDPNRITLFGESAGATSIALHALSPLSKGLFKRIILQSGAHTTPWAVISKEVALQRTRYLAGNLSCPNSDTTSELNLLLCLRASSAEDLFTHSWITSEIFDFPFVPVYPSSFLPRHPLQMLEQGNFSHVDMLAGFNSNEGSYFNLYAVPGFSKDTQSLITSTQYEAGIKLSGLRTSSLGRSATSFIYKDWKYPNNPIQYRDALDNIVAHFHIVCPILRAVTEQANSHPSANVYLYHLSYRISTNPWPLWMGVMHGYEIELVFGLPLVSPHSNNYTDDDRSVSRRMVRYWTNFAKYGNPSGLKADIWPIVRNWPRYNSTSQEYIEITLEGGMIRSPNPEALYCAFWEQYMPTLNTFSSTTNELDNVWRVEFQKWKDSMTSWESAFRSYKQKPTCN